MASLERDPIPGCTVDDSPETIARNRAEFGQESDKLPAEAVRTEHGDDLTSHSLSDRSAVNEDNNVPH